MSVHGALHYDIVQYVQVDRHAERVTCDRPRSEHPDHMSADSTDSPSHARDRVESMWQLPSRSADVRVAVGTDDRATAHRAERIVHDEVGRLDQMFSIDDDTCMLNRWIEDPSIVTSNEFDELLSTALQWQRQSRGVFNVSTRRLRNLWEQAAAEGCRPSLGELHELAIDLADAPYRFDGHLLRQVRDCRGLDLNAIATGFIIDQASEAAWRLCDLSSLTVCAYGKIVHRGPFYIEVRIGGLANRCGTAPTLKLRDAAVAMLHSDQSSLSVEGARANHLSTLARGSG